MSLRVQETGNTANGVTQITCAYTSDVTAGNLLVVSVCSGSSSGAADPFLLGDISQSAGTAVLGTFTMDVERSDDVGGGNYQRLAIYSVPVETGGSCTIRVANNSAWWTIQITEYSYTDTSGTRVAGTNENDGSGVDVSSGDVASGMAGVFVGAMGLWAGGTETIAEDGAFNLLAEYEDGANYEVSSYIDRIVSGDTTDAATWTTSSSGQWCALLAVYKDSGVAPPVTIDYFGETHMPLAENSSSLETGPTITFTPPANMEAGQLVLVWVEYRGQVTWTVSNAGGQTWSQSSNQQQGTTNSARLFWCVFDGTWDADPVFTVASGTSGCSGWMVVFDNVDPDTPWDVTPVIAGQAASLTFVLADFDTNSDNALAICGVSSADNNQWSVDNSFGPPSGSGNVYWRTAAGSDSSLGLATKQMPTAGSVGATTFTQTAVGSDLGTKWYGALKVEPTGAPVVTGAATVSGSAALAATALVLQLASSTILGAAALATAPLDLARGAATVSGAAIVSTSGAAVVSGAATITGAAAVAASGDVAGAIEVDGAATIAGVAAVAGSGLVLEQAAGTIQGAATIAASGVAVRPGVVTVQGAATVATSALVLEQASATLSGAAVVQASGDVAGAPTGAATITGGATVNTSVLVLELASATLQGSAAIVASGAAVTEGIATVQGAAAATASGLVLEQAAAIITGAAAVTASGDIPAGVPIGSATVFGSAAVQSSGYAITPIPVADWPRRRGA